MYKLKKFIVMFCVVNILLGVSSIYSAAQSPRRRSRVLVHIPTHEVMNLEVPVDKNCDVSEADLKRCIALQTGLPAEEQVLKYGNFKNDGCQKQYITVFIKSVETLSKLESLQQAQQVGNVAAVQERKNGVINHAAMQWNDFLARR